MKLIRTMLLLFLMCKVQGAVIVSPNTNLTSRELQLVAAAKTEAAPHFNGPQILGVRPGTPVIHSLSVTGERPMAFPAQALPRGLKLDPETGILTGTLEATGEYKFTVIAKNSRGQSETEMRVVCGDTLALTPPMGWNSYDAFGDSVTESEVIANARWLKEHLQPLGWDTVVVDFRWYDSLADGVRGQNPEGVTLDAFGRCVPPTNRFPSAAAGAGFRPLADKLHAMGLKFGIHIMRGIPRRAVEMNLPIHGTPFKASEAARRPDDPARECCWNRDMFGVDAATVAGKAWYADIARQYAGWGVDYIKCDDIAHLERGTNQYPELEVEALSHGLKASGRSIILSLSPGPALVNRSGHLKQFANLWRISGDFWDNWRSLNRNLDLFAQWLPSAGPGHWPDGDMIPFGHICQRNCDVKRDRWTRFTRDEQMTLLSLWALAPSPLMLGMNLPDNDEWTAALLTNPEVLAVNQDPRGQAARRLANAAGQADIWTKEMAGGLTAVGMFNRADKPMKVDVSFSHLGFDSPVEVRDLWIRSGLGLQTNFATELSPHGCVLLQLKPSK